LFFGSGEERGDHRVERENLEQEEREPESREWLSPQELAEFLNIGRTTSYRLLRENRIPSSRIGRLRRVHVADVRRFMAENRG
jgi:excisionase family DNA binding protein